MAVADIAILIVVFGFTILGLIMGFIGALGSLVGLVLAAWAAGRFYADVAGYFSEYIGTAAASLASFVLIFILVNRLIDGLFYLIKKTVSVVPFSKTVNTLAGLVFGFLEGILFAGIVIYVASRFSFSSNIDLMLVESKLAPLLVKSASIILGLLPEGLQKLQSII